MKKRMIQIGAGVLVLVGIVALGVGAIHAKRGAVNTKYDVQVELTDERRAAFEKQLTDAQAKIQSQPDKDRDWQAYLDGAWAARSLGQNGQAEAYYKAYMAKFPEDRRAITNEADILAKTGRLKEAEAIYVKLLSTSLIEEDLRTYLDILKAQNTDGSRDGDIEKAMESAVTSFGQSPFLMQELATWYEAHGQCDLAVDHLKVLAQVVNPDIRSQVESDMERVHTNCTNK